jgi:alcohol dehydrogenase class IV
VKDLKVPGLEELLLGNGNSGFSKAQIDEIVDGTLVASSTKGNPVTLSRDDLESILKLSS